MTASLTDELCTNCGLCCDGSLFEDVELRSGREAQGLELMGVQIDTDTTPSLPLPCTALNGKRCSIYKHRPNTCRRFECKLLQKTRCGEVSVSAAKSTINQTLKQAALIKTTCRELEGKKAAGSLREIYQFTLEQRDTQKDPDHFLYRRLNKEIDRMEALVTKHFIDL